MTRSRPLGPVASLAALLGPALLASACAWGQEAPGQVDEFTGCYQFERASSSRELGLPWGVRLLAAPLEDPGRFEGARRAVTLAEPDRTSDVPFNYWRFQEPGLVRVGFTGRGAISLDLELGTRRLVGTGRSVGDAVGPDETPDRTEYPVVAHEIVCPGG